MKTCCFAGHATLYDDKEIIKSKLNNEIIKMIKSENVITFYSGGKGDFDWLCANTLNGIKKDYSFIKSYLVRAYMPKEKNSYEEILYKQIFDKTIYPNIENVPKRLAIIKRNEWMIENSNFLIAYVKHDLGSGAYKTLKYAEKRKNIKIINIAKEV